MKNIMQMVYQKQSALDISNKFLARYGQLVIFFLSLIVLFALFFEVQYMISTYISELGSSQVNIPTGE